MLEIQRMTLNKAIKLLNSIGVEYAILAGEEKHGTLEIVKKKTKGRNKSRAYSYKYERGALRDYVRKYIEPLKVGEVTYIPKGNFELNEVSTAAASLAHFVFGKGSHVGRTDNEKQVFEVLRLES
jgi:hypothetical protein